MILLMAIFISSVSGSILFGSCSNEKESEELDTKIAKDQYIEAKVEKKDMASKLNLIGKAISEVADTISFELDGGILFSSKKGDIVKEGEILAKIDDEMIKEELSDLGLELKNSQEGYEHALRKHHYIIEAIEIKVKIAEEEYRQTTGSKLDKLTFDQKLLFIEKEKEQADYDLVEEETSLNNIGARYEDKKTLLDKVEIAAPYDCLVVFNSKSEGEMAVGGVEIVEIIGLDSMVVRIDIPEIDRTKIKEDMHVDMSFDVYPGKIITGKIYEIAKISKTTKAGTFFEAFIEFVDSEDIDVSNIYGLNADVEIIKEGAENVLVVPNNYIYKENGEEFVYRITGENDVEKILVETGISDLNYTVILSGLKEGDRVAIAAR